MLWWLAIWCGILTALATANEFNFSATTEWFDEWNVTDSNGVKVHDMIGQILQQARNNTGIEDRARSYIYEKNGEIKHEHVDDSRDVHRGKMEALIRLFEEKLRLREEMISRHGKGNASVDPHDELEQEYEKMKEEIMNKSNGTFFDPETEAEMNGTMNGSSSTSDEVKRGKRWNWGGYSAEWPKAIIPYEIHEGNLVGIRNAMDRYEDLTCIRFVKHNSSATNVELGLGHPGYLKFITKNGCWSYIGNHRWSDGQSISCCSDIPCVHELGHALGMLHEQNNYLRDGWLRANYFLDGLNQRGGEGTHFTLGYDLSSIMHYKPMYYAENGKPTTSLLFPELFFAEEDFYMFKEISYVQQCDQNEACTDFTIKCENDGYVTVMMGKCACRCPYGLDPLTGCTTTVNENSFDHHDLPRGQYALLMPKTGCPDSKYSFNEGQRIHYGEERNYYNGDDLKGEITETKAEHHFCVHDDVNFNGIVDGFLEPKSTWPIGKYCILRKGGECPLGMEPGHIQYDDMPPKDGQMNSQQGDLPDGVFGEDTLLEFCCQKNGNADHPINFPISKPFILFPIIFEGCQKIQGMHYKRNMIGFDSFNEMGYEIEGLMSYFDSEWNDYLALEYCYYTKADMDCGAIITLGPDNPETVIEIDGTGRPDLECSWLVKGENEDGNVVLNFDKFEVSCGDTLEVRHARIGQKGLTYCGEAPPRTIKSIFDKMMVQFTTMGHSNSKIKAKAQWLPHSEMCYDVTNRGANYNGKVNYTKLLEPCLPWTEVTTCQHHPWVIGDEMDNLEGNFCRNPDNSFGPWCYTDLEGCKRNYCDVCHKENLFDRSSDCNLKRDEGFCTDDTTAALHECGKTCRNELPNMGPDKKFTEIQCNRPKAPVDGVVVGDTKEKYALGEKAQFKCKHGGRSLSKTCLTNGDWSSLGFVCIECPFTSVLNNDSCYLFIDKQMNYVEAKKECDELGGNAAMPKSKEENDLISEIGKGKSLWLGLTDSKTEGEWVFEDGLPVEWFNWGDGEPNNWRNEENCASLSEKTKEWTDRVCDYEASWAKAAVVCQIPKVSNLACADFLEETRCIDLIKIKPSMCKDYPSFAEEYCAKSCGVCGSKNVMCTAEPASKNVMIEPSSGSVAVGDYITYNCTNTTFTVTGNEERACLPNGKLTGEPLNCVDPSEHVVFVNVGASVLSRYDYPLPYHAVYTGENAQWTIQVKGEIHAWEFYSNSPSEHAFQVWRVIEPKSKYKLIGQSIVKTGNDVEGRYELAKDERIQVEPGDLIAIWKSDSGGVYFNRCSHIDHPEWSGTSWSRMVDSPTSFKVGYVENFNTSWGCATYAFRAIVAIKGN